MPSPAQHAPNMEELGKPKDPLALPSAEKLREVAERQDAKAQEIREQRRQQRAEQNEKENNEQGEAAKVIQKNYRGYRARRALEGYGIDPGSRWMDILKEAKYINNTKPMSRNDRESMSANRAASIKGRWKRVGTIAHRAGSDDTESGSEVIAEDDEDRQRLKEQKRSQKAEREKYAKIMGLDYFLEMIDHKHRYGSNLRRYHAEWKKADTTENFFYWLDYGEGKDLDLEDRPRSRLDSEYVRYLSKEERKRYEVHVNHDGLFCWAKNGMRITTSPDFRDSVDGIVPVDDKTPTWRAVTTGVAPEPSPPGSDDSSLSGISTGSHEDAAKYTNDELHDAKGLAKFNHISVDTLMNHMLRKTTKKNTWIFVADTSFRLYIGIKQSGAFQHSSFLRGARVSAAGLIKIKRGQLRKLSPLSGHYAPPLKNFREFVKSLKEAGADLSRLSTSRSYAVLLGLEGYLGAKRHAKTAEQGVKDMIDPEGKHKREEEAKDKSKSAQREREILEEQARQQRSQSFSHRFVKKLGMQDDGSPLAKQVTR